MLPSAIIYKRKFNKQFKRARQGGEPYFKFGFIIPTFKSLSDLFNVSLLLKAEKSKDWQQKNMERKKSRMASGGESSSGEKSLQSPPCTEPSEGKYWHPVLFKPANGDEELELGFVEASPKRKG